MIATLAIAQFQFVYLIPLDHPKENDVLQMFNQTEELLGDSFKKLMKQLSLIEILGLIPLEILKLEMMK